MRLGAMADAFEGQCTDRKTYEGLPFEDRFGMLVDKEWDKRKSTKLQKIIRDADFVFRMHVWKTSNTIQTVIWIELR